jgi:hypothetical protein
MNYTIVGFLGLVAGILSLQPFHHTSLRRWSSVAVSPGGA